MTAYTTSCFEHEFNHSAKIATTDNYYEPNGTYYTQLYPADSQQTDNVSQILVEEGYWGSSPCSSDSHNGRLESPNSSSTTAVLHRPTSPFYQYAPVYYPRQYENAVNVPSIHSTEQAYDEGYYGVASTSMAPVPFVRVVKRRTTANKKERRRTQSINSAFTYLRDCIPNVPSDTKLSKIKTLRLATSYITYLTRVVEGDQDPSSGFRAELVPSSRKINAERRAKCEAQNALAAAATATIDPCGSGVEIKKTKGRTGWPQHVWASELKQECD